MKTQITADRFIDYLRSGEIPQDLVVAEKVEIPKKKKKKEIHLQNTKFLDLINFGSGTFLENVFIERAKSDVLIYIKDATFEKNVSFGSNMIETNLYVDSSDHKDWADPEIMSGNNVGSVESSDVILRGTTIKGSLFGCGAKVTDCFILGNNTTVEGDIHFPFGYIYNILFEENVQVNGNFYLGETTSNSINFGNLNISGNVHLQHLTASKIDLREAQFGGKFLFEDADISETFQCEHHQEIGKAFYMWCKTERKLRGMDWRSLREFKL